MRRLLFQAATCCTHIDTSSRRAIQTRLCMSMWVETPIRPPALIDGYAVQADNCLREGTIAHTMRSFSTDRT